MEVGETFQVQFGYTGVATGGEIGIRLRSAGATRLTLRFIGGQTAWMLNDGGSDFSTGISWAGGNPGTALNVAFTRNAGNGYSIQITSGTQSFTGNNYTASSGVMSIDSVEFFSIAQGVNENVGFDTLARIVPFSGSLVFGSRNVGSTSSPVSLTVRNTGQGTLGALAISRTGTNAPDFAAGEPAATTLAPGGRTTFTTTFTPSGNGNRTASLLVSSNDPDENPVIIALSGTGLNEPPTISAIADQTNTTTPIAFQIGDLETVPGSLSVLAQSDNQALIPDANITLGGSGTNRTITILPASNQTGNATITVTVDDGDLSASENFVFTVTGGGFSDWSVLDSLPAERRGPLDSNGPLDLPNILAYAMGLDPLAATAADLPALKSMNFSSGTATISYRRSKNAPGVSIDILGATSLQGGTWNPRTSEIKNVTDFQDHEWVEAEVSVPPVDRYFLRLRATQD
jgi:hypothetical protein